MYYWVKDKQFLKTAYSSCADIVNQLVQELEQYDIEARMNVVGSKSRNMVTQNENESIDFDFNVSIEMAPNIRDCRYISESVQEAFDNVLARNGWKNCKDSTSVFTTEERVMKKGNRTPFSIDVCVVREDSTGWYRLIHHKTGNVWFDSFVWEKGFNSDRVREREKVLKDNYMWEEVRAVYLDKKNMYLSRNDKSHHSFNCYIEAVNEVYYSYYGNNSSLVINSLFR